MLKTTNKTGFNGILENNPNQFSIRKNANPRCQVQ